MCYNLSKAIPFVSYHCTSGLLWIDQLCIDQRNIPERNQQVELMGAIYLACENCLVWLEEEAPLDNITRILLEEGESHGDVFTGDFDRIQSLNLSPTDSAWKRAFQLIRNPYFGRAWIVQEVLLPKVSLAIFGTDLIPFTRLAVGLHAFGAACIETLLPNSEWPISTLFGTAFYYIQNKIERQYQETLSEMTWCSQATDPRDLVYAFLGLKGDDDIDIQPDYAASVDEVYTRVAMAFIKGTHSLGMFRSLSQYQEQIEIALLPSWVPDWRTNTYIYTFDHPLPPTRSASKCRVHVWKTAEDPKYLEVAGGTIDSVGLVLRQYPVHPTSWPTLDDKQYLGIDSILATLTGETTSNYQDITRARILGTVLAGSMRGQWVSDSIKRYPAVDLEDYENMLEAYDNFSAGELNTSFAPTSLHDAYIKVMQHLSRVTEQRSLFVTKSGKLGLARRVQKDDIITILHGSDYPVVLRDAGDSR
ncbi:HET-domain-containing protein [Tothia fuscella]|uniref:HET-domain-containing protein n=1 Tax=Tothia fuscella TaxID=1048955 RepID=A0A9P4NI36_9PEZI|nr:HET-domain-containing protein [Tothia fuscella]